jgi:hypothetical protein
MRETPKKGSLRESVLLLYCLKREEIAYMRDLAMAQIQVSKDKGIELFNEYRKAMFPWVDTATKREETNHKKILEQFVKAGPIGVRPLQEKRLRSRMVHRKEMKQDMTEEQKREKKRKQDELYAKLGKTIPV